MEKDKDFLAKEPVGKLLLRLALPTVLAQLINMLYNIVDRMYIGHIPEEGAMALTGVGVCMPLIMIVAAFAALVGNGGAPRASIFMGQSDYESAEKTLGNCFTLQIIISVVLTAVLLIFNRTFLLAFGASEKTIGYAVDYMNIYAIGTIFVQLTLGMNAFITAQGFAKTGMLSVLIGAAANIVLDPLFIFAFDMGVRGAALATVLSQLASALWVIGFLTGKKTLYRLELRRMRLRLRLVWEIVSLGAAGFIMSFTTSAVQVVCNAMLAQFGGDLFVGVMTVINSIREVTYAPVSGITNAANPVMGFNYGAQAYRRVRTAIRFVSLVCVGYMTVVWLLLMLFPRFFIGIFNDDPTLVEACADSMFIYFFGCFMMSLQMAGQAAAQALGRSKQAIFFSLLRKVVIVIPLTLILPQIPGVGVHGVFLAEAISNFLGGGACFITMLCTIWRELKQKEKTAQAR